MRPLFEANSAAREIIAIKEILRDVFEEPNILWWWQLELFAMGYFAPEFIKFKHFGA
jgi:hypothetical protein